MWRQGMEASCRSDFDEEVYDSRNAVSISRMGEQG